MSRARIPRRVKQTWIFGKTPARQRRWKLVRRYYLRLSAAVKAREPVTFQPTDMFARMRLVYRLEGHRAVWEPHTIIWAMWMERAETNALRQVGLDTVGSCRISTVFLGCNYSWTDDRPPLLFETMVFDEAHGPHDYDTWRYHTWDEAAAGHAVVVARLQRGEAVDEDA